MDELQKMGQSYLEDAALVQKRILQLQKEKERYIKEKRYYLIEDLQKRIITLNNIYFEMIAIGRKFA